MLFAVEQELLQVAECKAARQRDEQAGSSGDVGAARAEAESRRRRELVSWCRELGVGCGCFHSVFVVVLISFGAGPALIFHVPVPHLWCRRELVDRLHQAASDNTALQRRVKEGEQAAADYRCPCLRRRASSRSAHRRILSLQTRARGRVNHRAESAQRAAAHSHNSGFARAPSTQPRSP